MKRFSAAVFALGFFAFGCKGPTEPPEEPTVQSVSVSPNSTTLNSLGDTQQFKAKARDADGNPVSGVTFIWSSSDESVATVDENGLATAQGNGETIIRAEVSGVSGTATLAVNQEISTVEVSPEEAVLSSLGDTQQFEAEAWDANGNLISDVTFIWSSSDESVATVDKNGLATAKRAGETLITAKTGEVSGTAYLTVEREDLIAFSGNPGRFSGNETNNDDIYAIRPDGTGLRRITKDSAQDILLTWSPDGMRIAFVSNRTKWNVIYSVNLDGSNITPLTPDISYAMFPAWSPVDNRIAFQGKVHHEDPVEIFTLDLENGKLTQLTNEGVSGKAPTKPSWSPDGSQIAFSTFRDGNWEIYVMDAADGANQMNVTNNPATDGEPSWSPDGSQIAFWSDRDGNAEIYIMNTDGSNQTNMTNNPGTEIAPAWSPDGTMIAFTGWSDEFDLTSIYILDVQTGERTRLINTSDLLGSFPAWRPQQK